MLRFVADLTQSFFSNQDQPTRRKTKATASIQYQDLEARQMLASISFDASNGFLTLSGDNTADFGTVTELVSDNGTSLDITYQVELNGMSETFTNTPITNILFLGNDGNDQFTNNSRLPSFASGGLGNDIFVGGFGADTFVGGEGNDTLSGAFGNDQLFGGEGDDILNGGAGNDLLSGTAGDDTINGDAGDDTAIGGIGDDTINGGIGDDDLFGTDGADEIFGGDGDDIIGGNEGDDRLEGGLGNDQLFGNAGNDILNGGEGDDNLFGSLGDDTLNGQAGDDLLAGDVGDDLLVGGDGLNTIFGGDDDDRIFGGLDRDLLYGQDGDDIIFGNNGEDVVSGGDGDDELNGGLGDDLLVGGDGADQLHGGLGADSLFGGLGNDSLVGGVGAADSLAGNAGQDIFVANSDSDILDFNSNNDVQVEFRNGSSTWTNREIQVINEGLFRLQQITGNAQVLSSPLVTEPLVFIKELTIAAEPGGRLATNEEVSFFDVELNPNTNQFDSVERIERRISFAEWDETDDAANLARLIEVPREVALMWAGPEPITALLPLQAGYWDSFLQISGWTETRPDDIAFFDVTPDGEEFFLRSAAFVEDAGMLSSDQDFATTWKFIVQQAFAAPSDVVPIDDALISKLASVDRFFALLGSTNNVVSPGDLITTVNLTEVGNVDCSITYLGCETT